MPPYISDLKVDMITNQGIFTGVGRAADETFRVLRPYFPNLSLYSFNYIAQRSLKGSIPISKYSTHNLLKAPFVNWKNVKSIKKYEIFKNSNLHIIGTDYSLTKVAKNSIILAHELYYVINQIFKANSFKEMIKEMGFNYSEYLLSRYIKDAKIVMAPSKFSANQIEQKTGIKPIVAYYSVDTKKFTLRNKYKARKALNLPLNKKILLNVAGGGSNKNLTTLSEISNLLDESYVLVKANAPINGKRCLNLGLVAEEDYPLLFNAADLYLHTSTMEGFGFPLLESIASGLPVVSSRTSTAPEILSSCGNYIDNPYNAPAYIQKIVEILDSTIISEYEANSYERSRYFSDEQFANILVDTYEKTFT